MDGEIHSGALSLISPPRRTHTRWYTVVVALRPYRHDGAVDRDRKSELASRLTIICRDLEILMDRLSFSKAAAWPKAILRPRYRRQLIKIKMPTKTPPGKERAADLYGVGVANGTFGELLQGAIPDPERRFLVTLPINRRSKATFFRGPSDTTLEVISGRKRKCHRLARRLLRHIGVEEVGVLRIESELAEGKGLASSSADAVATARAIGNALGVTLELEVLFRILRGIEPTDGVMYDGIVAFLHRKVRLLRRFGPLPRPLRIVAVDEGGEIDTLTYNRECPGYTPSEQETYLSLLEQVGEAFNRGDLEAIGRIATRSAVLNQRRNPRRYLAEVLTMGQELGALGVVVTHSGPYLGLLFESEPHHDAAVEEAHAALPSLNPHVSSFRSLQRPSPHVSEQWNRPINGPEMHAPQAPSFTLDQADDQGSDA